MKIVFSLLALLMILSGCSSEVSMQQSGGDSFASLGSYCESAPAPDIALFISEEFFDMEKFLSSEVAEHFKNARSQFPGCTIQFYGCKGCTDLACTDPDHFHWCPAGCKEVEHYHAKYQWKQLQ